ncbi:MAG: beta-mannosidase, partial [Saprospiraceae bacterium]
QGALLGSKDVGGDRRRLRRELKQLQKMGVTNLRILVGAEGPDDQPHRVTPALQTASGQYNETLFDGLDYLLRQMKKRDLKAVLFLTNSWEWSGGFAQYLNWNGYGPIPYPQENTWPTFMQYLGQYYVCPPCQEQFFQHVRTVLGRTNRYTGVRYAADPTIMSWEIANEPRAFSTHNLPAMQLWLEATAMLIKSIDPNHLVTTGSEGAWGCENSLDWFERMHALPGIDYMTVHIWPKNWSWIDAQDIPGTLDTAIARTNAYLDLHLAVAQRLQKPLVLEEFGRPRDGHVTPKD